MNLSFVFYEDQAARGVTANFGPHRLLCSCIADRLVGVAESRQLQRHFVSLRPCRGVGDQVRALANTSTPLLTAGTSVIAIFDNDRIRSQLGLPEGAPEHDVKQALHVKGVPGAVIMFLLEQNTEILMQAALNCLHSVDAAISQDLPKRNPLERDAVLNRVADANRGVRECIEERVPSFLRAVETILKSLTGPPPPPST